MLYGRTVVPSFEAVSNPSALISVSNMNCLRPTIQGRMVWWRPMCILSNICWERLKAKRFEEAFSTWKNFKRPGRDSPNTLFFGRHLRMKLPEVSSPFSVSRHYHDNTGDKLWPLKEGDPVWMQDQDGKWPFKGHVVRVDNRGHMYQVQLLDGRVFRQKQTIFEKTILLSFVFVYLSPFRLGG